MAKPMKTMTEAEFRARIAEGWSIASIAKDLGCDPSYIYSTSAVLGIKVPRAKAGRKSAAGEYFADFKKHGNIDKTAKNFGSTYQAVRICLQRAGLPNTSRSLLAHMLAHPGGVDIDAVHRKEPKQA